MHVSILGKSRCSVNLGGFETFAQDFAFFFSPVDTGHGLDDYACDRRNKLKTRRSLLQPHRIPPPKESMRPMAAITASLLGYCLRMAGQALRPE
jgi:hypothetical protein